MTFHGGKHRFRQPPPGSTSVLARPAKANGGTGCQFGQIRAGTKGSRRPGQNGDPGLVIGLECGEDIMQGLHGFHIAGVFHLRPVDGDNGDGAFPVLKHLAVGVFDHCFRFQNK